MALDIAVLTPKEVLFEGKAISITLPGESGVFEILSFHKSLLSRLVSGVVDIDDKSIEIKRGIVKVHKNKVVLIVEVP